MNTEIRILPITGIGEIRSGNDLGVILFAALSQQQLLLQTGDILVVTHKIVSKAEGRIIKLAEIEPSELARKTAQRYDKDARHVEAVLRESKRIVRMDHGVIISETEHGFICANAGIDESNVSGNEGELVLLPIDPDQSARQLRTRLQDLSGESETLDFGIVISDTWGRPWRNGQVNMAIGTAGLEPLSDYRGQTDPYGYEMHASVIAVADELASAAELVMGKIDKIPVALIRGYAYTRGESNAQTLLRDPATDMFR